MLDDVKIIIFSGVLFSLILCQGYGQTKLAFRFSNPLITDSSTPVFQFDVAIKASEDDTILNDIHNDEFI